MAIRASAAQATETRVIGAGATGAGQRVIGDRWIDITAPDSYRGGVPHASFQRLRDEQPVAWTEECDGSGFWSITRSQDIVACNRDLFEAFASRQGIRLEQMDEQETEARRTMMEMDPPEHTRLRRLVQGGFTRAVDVSARHALKRAIAAWEERGYIPKIGIELEAFILQRSDDATPCVRAVEPDGLRVGT